MEVEAVLYVESGVRTDQHHTLTQNSTGPAVTCASGDGCQDLVQARQVFCHGEVPEALGNSLPFS